MSQKILMALTVIVCFSFLHADDNTVDWNEEDKKEVVLEEKTQELRELIVEIDMIASHAVQVAEETLVSLNNNLDFFEKIETDETYRECVVLEEYIKDIDKDTNIASKLFKKKKVTAEQYENYLSEAGKRKNRLEDKINEKKCK